MAMAITRIKMEDLVGIETLRIGEEEGLLEKMEIQMEVTEVLTLMIVGMGMILHPQQILLLLEGEGIGGPCLCITRTSRTTRSGRTTWTSRTRWQRWASTAIG